MTDLDDLDRLRTDYLLALYSKAGPSSMNMPRNSAVVQEIGIDASTGTEIARWLKQRGFIGKMTMGDHAMELSPSGADEAERIIRERRSRLEHASHSLVILTPAELRRVEAAVGALEREAISDRLHGDDLAEYEADLATVQAQIRSPRPKREIVTTALKRLGVFAVQFGSGVAAGLVANALG